MKWLDTADLPDKVKARIRAAYAALPRHRCPAVDPSLHPSVKEGRCELELDHPGTLHRREAVCPGFGQGVITWRST